LPTFYFVNYSKQIFSANRIPKTPDETDAFFARQIIINFPNQFFGDNIDYYIIDKLTTPEELSGLLKVVLRRLPRVLKEGIKRTTADSIADNYQKYITSSDPVRAFYENMLYLDAGVTIPKDQLYQAYQDFCKKNSLSPESEQSFSRTLTKEPYKFEYKWLKGVDDKEKKYHSIGVGIKGGQPTTDENQSTIII
jgi:putative DNA primase/helicase